jgi:hypothetical protein
MTTIPAETPPTETSEPRTAQQERSGRVGQADLLPNPPNATDGHTGPPGGDPPNPPSTRHGPGEKRPDRPRVWERLALWGIFALLALLSAYLIGKAWVKIDQEIWGTP